MKEDPYSDMPMVDQYNQGIADFKNNRSRPVENTEQYREWSRGWNAAYFKAERKAHSVERSRGDV
jgi:hypothetical protein